MCVCSVHPFAAVDGSAVTRDLMLIVLQVELVVVAQLFSSLDASAGADDDLVLLLHRHHLSDTVGST